MSVTTPGRLRKIVELTLEIGSLPDELVRACKQLDAITRDKQRHRSSSTADRLEVARDLLHLAMDLRPEVRSPLWLQLRAHELGQILDEDLGHAPILGDGYVIVPQAGVASTSTQRWAEVWERFEAALTMCIGDVLNGCECDLSGRLILWRPPVRSSS